MLKRLKQKRRLCFYQHQSGVTRNSSRIQRNMTRATHNESKLDVSSLEKQTSPQSRSWKRRKKFRFDVEIQEENSSINIIQGDIPPQNELSTVSLKSSRSNRKYDHRKHHNYRLSCSFTKQLFTNKVSVLFRSIVIRLFISMSLPFHNRMHEQKCFNKNTNDLLKPKKHFLRKFDLNLISFCSFSSKIISLVIIMSSLGVVCHALKNEFRKSNIIL